VLEWTIKLLTRLSAINSGHAIQKKKKKQQKNKKNQLNEQDEDFKNSARTLNLNIRVFIPLNQTEELPSTFSYKK
jgi:hypothetical protein